jgi:hypothetical protein
MPLFRINLKSYKNCHLLWTGHFGYLSDCPFVNKVSLKRFNFSWHLAKVSPADRRHSSSSARMTLNFVSGTILEASITRQSFANG